MNGALLYIMLLALSSCNSVPQNTRDITPQQKAAFEAMDVDHDGAINSTEWKRELSITANEIQLTDRAQAEEYRDRMLKLFIELDTNRDGKLSADELIEQ